MAINTNPIASTAAKASGTQLTNFIPAVWSKHILDKLKEECILVDNCWQEYEGEVQHAGSVHILGIGNVTVGDYTGSVTYNKVTDEGQTLIIDQAKYFALQFDDVERAQTVPGLWEGTRQEAVEKLAIARDTYIGEKIAGGANKTTIASIDPEVVRDGIDAAIVALKERNMTEKADIELTPAVAMAFLKMLTEKSTDNPEYIKKGVIGFYHGHKVVESNCLKVNGTKHYCAIRGKKAIAFAGQINKVEALRLEGAFADAVRGLDVYGAKVIDDNRMQVLEVTATKA